MTMKMQSSKTYNKRPAVGRVGGVQPQEGVVQAQAELADPDVPVQQEVHLWHLRISCNSLQYFLVHGARTSALLLTEGVAPRKGAEKHAIHAIISDFFNCAEVTTSSIRKMLGVLQLLLVHIPGAVLVRRPVASVGDILAQRVNMPPGHRVDRAKFRVWHPAGS